ncbi:MAG TPA: VOC family protein [Nitrospiria bacterium]|nr:VOC family protein [Nitrospiria bacterium]
MIKSIAFTAYPVTDMARSKGFYENVLGLKVGYNFKDKWVEYNVADSAFAITTTEMGHLPGAKGAVVAFEVTDLDSFVKTLKDNGVTFVADTFSTPVCRMAVIQDPDQNDITVHQRHGH